MIRTALIAAATVAAIATAATSAQAGYNNHGYGGYNNHGHTYSHGYTQTYKPSFHYERRCHKVKVGHKKVYDPYTYRTFFKAIFKTRCRNVKVWH